jgi:predicted metal-dependent hydrolase
VQLKLFEPVEPPTRIVFVRHRRARRFVMRVLADGTVRVTLPRWAAKRDARAFVDANRDWVAEQRQRRLAVAQRVSIRDQRSRWGSCSAHGTITLNWRLILVPEFVCEYVLLHELMHRRELNHSRRFWRLVAACCPRHLDARRWLKNEGKRLWSHE